MNSTQEAICGGIAIGVSMLLAILFILTFSGCTTLSVKQCLPLKPYTVDQMTALANALGTLPDSSPLVLAIVDYEQLRAADRACIASDK